MGRIQKIVVQKLSLLPETDSIQKIVRHTHKQREREREVFTNKTYLENPSQRNYSQEILDFVKLTIKTNHHSGLE